jgi:hypothetical protein
MWYVLVLYILFTDGTLSITPLKYFTDLDICIDYRDALRASPHVPEHIRYDCVLEALSVKQGNR